MNESTQELLLKGVRGKIVFNIYRIKGRKPLVQKEEKEARRESGNNKEGGEESLAGPGEDGPLSSGVATVTNSEGIVANQRHKDLQPL